MQAQPALASKLSWIRTLLVVVALTATSVVMLAIITDDDAETGCGGG